MSEEVKTGIYGYPLRVDSRYDLALKAVSVYATLEEMKRKRVTIRKKATQVLAFYLLFGYSRETNNLITETLKISMDNLTQINAEITRDGYLIRDQYNFRKKELNADLNNIRATILDSGNTKKAMLIRFDIVKDDSEVQS